MKHLLTTLWILCISCIPVYGGKPKIVQYDTLTNYANDATIEHILFKSNFHKLDIMDFINHEYHVHIANDGWFAKPYKPNNGIIYIDYWKPYQSCIITLCTPYEQTICSSCITNSQLFIQQDKVFILSYKNNNNDFSLFLMLDSYNKKKDSYNLKLFSAHHFLPDIDYLKQ